METVKAVIEVNEKQKTCLIEKSKKYYNSLKGLTVAVLGITFKPETDDLREAPAIENIEYLESEGAKIKIWDPLGSKKIKNHYSSMVCMDNIDETIKNTDICFIFTEWNKIKEYNVENYEKLMKKPIILDGRNCYDTDIFKNTNIIYEPIGEKGHNI